MFILTATPLPAVQMMKNKNGDLQVALKEAPQSPGVNCEDDQKDEERKKALGVIPAKPTPMPQTVKGKMEMLGNYL